MADTACHEQLLLLEYEYEYIILVIILHTEYEPVHKLVLEQYLDKNIDGILTEQMDK